MKKIGYSNPEEVKREKFERIKRNFEWHYRNNPFYREYCKLYPYISGNKKRITPDDIKKYEDLNNIPLLVSDWFKELSVRGLTDIIVPENLEIVDYFTTSGTTGEPTKYPFDRESIEETKLMYSYLIEILGVEKGDKVIFLTPSPEKSSTGLVRGGYMMYSEVVGKDDIYFLFDETTEPEKAIDTLREISSNREGKVHLFGPPFAFLELCEYLIKRGEKIEINGTAFTSGGWKRYKGGTISKEELEDLISETLGIKKENIRDGLGLTDIMTVLLECEKHQKHVHPWLYVSIRNPEDFTERLPPREEGLISFMSPTIRSYPAYVITGDIGEEILTEDEICECGRVGNSVIHKRRAKGTQARGCALVLEQLIEMMKK